ncbi:helix-turn-helix transcriptional regulator [Streptomyces sp. ISL-1]|uniref:helix-turn-helix transcriptional regulator n=1 Tax=Streptomyces sp. ISL-1 TaxID=2817657 RepID=UPI001BEA3AA8|nr:helix-turn-helix transcriptional regulator [Streptomyces sp. ISL-1]MBT2391990.1 helix-turn-helix transcriptional regulator [Streptomyces sp. ISL-1]
MRDHSTLGTPTLRADQALPPEHGESGAVVARPDAPVQPRARRAVGTPARHTRIAAAGDLSSARDILGDAAADAQRQGMWTLESQLLSDIARLGDPASVANRLTELAKLCDGQFVAARAEHASALTEHDPGRLADVSARLEALGTPLLAAEAATAAAEAYQGLGGVRAATAMSFRASNLAAQCEGARTPGLVRVDSAIPLTRREFDVALLASRGMASREIAERLVLSPRTVNNHLQRAYTKLGVTSRTELAEAMGPPDGDSRWRGPPSDRCGGACRERHPRSGVDDARRPSRTVCGAACRNHRPPGPAGGARRMAEKTWRASVPLLRGLCHGTRSP